MMPDFRTSAMEVLSYDADGGQFYWKVPRGPCPAGAVAGTIKDGYVIIHVGRRLCRAHRLAWLFQTGDWPPKGFFIDHVNRDRSDNRWSNLRLADQHQNGTNSTLRSDNTSGCVGVYRHSAKGPGWQAKICKGGRMIHVGHFATREEAMAARIEAANRLYGAFSPHLEGLSP